MGKIGATRAILLLPIFRLGMEKIGAKISKEKDGNKGGMEVLAGPLWAMFLIKMKA